MVPTYSRPERLSRLLKALTLQSVPAERFEVIVIDDGSPPETRPPDRMAGANQYLYRQDNTGPAAARNAGAAKASGQLLVFIDDDCIPDVDWLNALIEAHRQAPAALLGGLTENGLPCNPFSTTSESLMHFFDNESLRLSGHVEFLASNNLALSRDRFLDLGGFDTTFPLAAGEDRDLCRRWLQLGLPLQRAAAARIRHFHELTFVSFWRQHQNYGRGAARFHASPSDSTSRMPVSFYARLLFHPWSRRTKWATRRRLVVTALVFVSQLAITSGLLREHWRATDGSGT